MPRRVIVPFVLVGALILSTVPAWSMGGGTPRAYIPVVFVPLPTPPTATATPTRTPTPLAPTPTATATPGPSNLLLNPGFEQGFTDWTPYGYAELSSFAHGGAMSAWLGGYDNADDAVSQYVSIPACAQSGTISYWLYPISTATREGILDKVRVSIFDASTFSYIYVGDNWIQQALQDGPWTFRQDTISAVSQYAGHAELVSIAGTTDSSYWSAWYVDDVALTFTC